ncbi:MAG: hypothetical protein GXP28_08230 [Planctomycetes bacterium]|nr:hypothetical protein [Planctomycetota bacterium]
MATLKKKRKKGPPLRGLARVKQWLWSRGRAVVALLVVALLGWGMQVVWQRAAPSIIHRDRYLLTAEGIEISTLPSWITADVRMEVVRNSGLDRRLSVLDEAFVSVVEDAFALHPWVESVDKITKSYPPAVFVDLTFRRPVAVVELASAEGVQLIPVDKLGIQLPAENVPDISKRYLPRIGGIVGRPPVGQQWADPRVIGATELAELLADNWESLHLVDILPSARPEIREEHRYFVFHLITRGGTRVVWGAAPSHAPPGEDNFEAKLERLRKCAKQLGPLDSVRGPAVVDVRRELAITPRTVKNTTPRTVKNPPATDQQESLVK